MRARTFNYSRKKVEKVVFSDKGMRGKAPSLQKGWRKM